jgi:hypothetical protein
MKKLIPAIIAILIIPFAIACKKGTNSTGTVTNGVARVELTFSPALPVGASLYLDIMSKAPGGSSFGSIEIPDGTSKYVSDDYAVTEGQNFSCYYNSNQSGTACASFTSKIYYNNNLISTKNLVLGLSSSCTNGKSSEHNAICK